MSSLNDQLNCVSILVDGIKDDVAEWQKRGSRAWSNGYEQRVNATQIGIKKRIQTVRSLLLQISKDIDKEMK